MSGYVKKETAGAPAMDDQADGGPEMGGRKPDLRGMGYAAQVQALSPLKGGGPQANGGNGKSKEPASLKRFEHAWRRFMRAVDKAEPDSPEHANKLDGLAIDLISAAKRYENWTDTHVGKAERACNRAQKAYFKWRRSAQKAGLPKHLIEIAWKRNRQIIDIRNELRAGL